MLFFRRLCLWRTFTSVCSFRDMCSYFKGSEELVAIGANESPAGNSQSSSTESLPISGLHAEVPCPSTASEGSSGSKSGEPCTTATHVVWEPAQTCPSSEGTSGSKSGEPCTTATHVVWEPAQTCPSSEGTSDSKSGEPCTTATHVVWEPAQTCPSSSSSSCCRICQDSGDTSEPLGTSRCSCKGQLARVHRSCLVEWVRYKGSNRCEICGGTFRDVSPPPSLLGINELEHLESLRQHLAHFQPLSQRKRTALAGFIIFLVIASGLTGILTFGADKEFQRVTGNPAATDHETKRAHIVFSICLSFLFFCVTLTLGLILMWIIIEVYFYIQRRRIMQHAARRLIAEIRRRSATTQSTSV